MFDDLPTSNNNQKQKQGGASLLQTNQGNTQKTPLSQTAYQNSAPVKKPLNNAVNNIPTATNSPEAQNKRPIVPNIPQQAKKPIEDMFSETDNQAKPAIFQAKKNPSPLNQGNEITPTHIDPYTGEQIKAKNKTIVFSLMLISLMLVFILGYYAYRIFFINISPSIVEPIVSTKIEKTVDTKAPEQKASLNLFNNNSSNTKEDQIKDSDEDGLSDEEERRLGTNILSSDTDGDGLFDREEVKVYKTDPLEADSDKDGYADGIEVDGGYNPNGEGSLYNIKK